MNADRDRLIDMLLRELLAEESPPDVTDRCLTRVHIASKRRRWIQVTAVASIAATLVFAWFSIFKGPSYPAPVATGVFEIVDGSEVSRGATLQTRTGKAEVVLGGYSRVVLRPTTTVRLEGTQNDEEVFLKAGQIDCNVDRNVGSFTVRTEVGMVRVKGTRFTVHVFEAMGDGEVMEKRMIVSVLVGAVLVSSEAGVTELSANESEFFVLRKEKDPREGKKGRVIGILTAKGRNRKSPFIEVKAIGDDQARKYHPHWRGGAPAQGGGFDKKTLALFETLKVGSRIQLDWSFQERPRVDSVKVLSVPKDSGKGVKEGQKGRLIGIVASKGKVKNLGPYIEVKAVGDDQGRKYYPHWRGGFGGHFDKKTMAIFEELKIGTRVQLDWSYQERLRVEGVKVLAKP